MALPIFQRLKEKIALKAKARIQAKLAAAGQASQVNVLWPLVLVRRDQKIAWTNADKEIWRQFLKSTTWAKLLGICEDVMIQKLLPKHGVIGNPEVLGAYVAGAAATLDLLYRCAALERELPAMEDDDPPKQRTGLKQDEMTTIQMDVDE